MVTNERTTNEQPSEPGASPLVEKWTELTFAILFWHCLHFFPIFPQLNNFCVIIKKSVWAKDVLSTKTRVSEMETEI